MDTVRASLLPDAMLALLDTRSALKTCTVLHKVDSSACLFLFGHLAYKYLLVSCKHASFFSGAQSTADEAPTLWRPHSLTTDLQKGKSFIRGM